MLLSELPFFSFLSYLSKREPDTAIRQDIREEALRSRAITYRLKQNSIELNSKKTMCRYLVEVLHARLDSLPFSRLFSGSYLVPVPGNAPTKSKDSLWVPRSICEEMASLGIGISVKDLIERVEAVPKAAYYRSGGHTRRTAKQHFESFGIKQLTLGELQKIILVDDVITQGATMLGAASKILEAYPGVEIRGFAMIRTLSFSIDFQAIYAPCIGTVSRDGELTTRKP